MDVSELGTSGILAGLSDADRVEIAAVFRTEEYPVGAVLIHEGDLPTKFYIIIDGTVTVHRGGAHVVDLGAGDICGELGVVSLEPRNATVIATTSLRVAVAMGWDLRELLDVQPELRSRLETTAAERTASD